MKKGEKMRKKRIHRKSLFLLAALVCTAVFLFAPVQSQAASKTTRAKVQKAYRNFLYESDYRSFKLIDVNRDGMKELVVSYDDSRSTISQIFVYTYRNGFVQRVGEDYSAFGITYNKKTKRLYGSRGGGGGIENWYYTFDKGGRLKPVYLQALERGYNHKGPLYNYYYNGKKISSKKYRAKLKTWTKASGPLKLYGISMKNIKKHIKVRFL